MLRHLVGLDHAVILVRDLERARDTYERLGFSLTPLGRHSLGSRNHCIMFARDYLELMALPASPPPALQRFAERLARGEGVGALALATDDAIAAHGELLRAGIAAEAPLALSRPVEGLGEARFTLVPLPPEATPGLHTFVCQHHTRELVWRPEYQRHALGAVAIDAVALAVPDPEKYRALLGRLPVEILQAPVAAVTALRIRVAERTQAASALRRGGFTPAALADGTLVIPAGEAHGVALSFR